MVFLFSTMFCIFDSFSCSSSLETILHDPSLGLYLLKKIFYHSVECLVFGPAFVNLLACIDDRCMVFAATGLADIAEGRRSSPVLHRYMHLSADAIPGSFSAS